MLSRLRILESHITANNMPSENLLDKYRKMSNLDLKLLDEIYYLGNKDTMEIIHSVLRDHKAFK